MYDRVNVANVLSARLLYSELESGGWSRIDCECKRGMYKRLEHIDIPCRAKSANRCIYSEGYFGTAFSEIKVTFDYVNCIQRKIIFLVIFLNKIRLRFCSHLDKTINKKATTDRL